MINPAAELIRQNPAIPGQYILETEVWLPRPLEEVFAFFSDAFQLETITPPWLNFHVLTPRPIEMRPGTLIDYRVRLYGLPVHWRSEISVWEPPLRFVDTQLRGPYRLWRHEHSFFEQDGGTLVRDRVDYRPLGGALAQRLIVGRDLRRIFEFRTRKLREVFKQSAVQPIQFHSSWQNPHRLSFGRVAGP